MSSAKRVGVKNGLSELKGNFPFRSLGCNLPLKIPGLIHLRKGFTRACKRMGLYPMGYITGVKNRFKQALAVLSNVIMSRIQNKKSCWGGGGLYKVPRK